MISRAFSFITCPTKSDKYPDSRHQCGVYCWVCGIIRDEILEIPQLALIDTKVRSLKGQEKQYKVADGRGLFLVITPTGSKYWRFRYRYVDREKSLTIGIYPDVSLAKARDKAHEARKMLANNIDPGADKQNKKRAQKLAAANTFETIAREWFQKNSTRWNDSHGERIMNRLEKDVFPFVGKRPITELSAPEILTVLQRIENSDPVYFHPQNNCIEEAALNLTLTIPIFFNNH